MQAYVAVTAEKGLFHVQMQHQAASHRVWQQAVDLHARQHISTMPRHPVQLQRKVRPAPCRTGTDNGSAGTPQPCAQAGLPGRQVQVCRGTEDPGGIAPPVPSSPAPADVQGASGMLQTRSLSLHQAMNRSVQFHLLTASHVPFRKKFPGLSTAERYTPQRGSLHLRSLH